MQTLFIHTLDGQPATYRPGEQIVYGVRTQHAATSMQQIRKEQKASRAFRLKLLGGKPDPMPAEYGHIRIATP